MHERHARAGGHPWQQKTQVLHGVGMGSRLRGNDAAVLLPAPYVQQSRTIARTFAPITVPAFAGTTLRPGFRAFQPFRRFFHTLLRGNDAHSLRGATFPLKVTAQRELRHGFTVAFSHPDSFNRRIGGLQPEGFEHQRIDAARVAVSQGEVPAFLRHRRQEIGPLQDLRHGAHDGAGIANRHAIPFKPCWAKSRQLRVSVVMTGRPAAKASYSARGAPLP